MALVSAGYAIDTSAAAVDTTDEKPVASCFIKNASVSESEVQAFLAEPNNLLDKFPNGGVAMTTRVRSLVGSSEAALDAIIALLPNASTEQQKRIGAGLARAAKECEGSDAKYAQRIQVKLLAAKIGEAEAAFNSTTKEIETAVLGSGGGGGGNQASNISGGGTAGNGGSGGGSGGGTGSGSTTYSVGSGGSLSKTDNDDNDNDGNSQF